MLQITHVTASNMRSFIILSWKTTLPTYLQKMKTISVHKWSVQSQGPKLPYCGPGVQSGSFLSSGSRRAFLGGRGRSRLTGGGSRVPRDVRVCLLFRWMAKLATLFQDRDKIILRGSKEQSGENWRDKKHSAWRRWSSLGALSSVKKSDSAADCFYCASSV